MKEYVEYIQSRDPLLKIKEEILDDLEKFKEENNKYIECIKCEDVNKHYLTDYYSLNRCGCVYPYIIKYPCKNTKVISIFNKYINIGYCEECKTKMIKIDDKRVDINNVKSFRIDTIREECRKKESYYDTCSTIEEIEKRHKKNKKYIEKHILDILNDEIKTIYPY
jgi:hypothetical protein